MRYFERVTVALGLDPVDQDLLRHASLLRDLGKGEVQFSFVHFLPTAGDGPRGSQAGHSAADAAAAMRAAVASHFGEAGAVDVQVLSGPLLDGLLESVERSKADLLLVGHRRDARGRRATSRRLAMKSACSLWMVPEGSPARISGVLAATDFSEPSAQAVTMAARIASRAGLATCSLLHVLQPEHGREPASSRDPWREFEAFLSPLDLCGLDVRELVAETGSVAQALARNVAEAPADLAVVGSRGRNTSAAVFLGLESDSVLLESKIPVLVTKGEVQSSGASAAKSIRKEIGA